MALLTLPLLSLPLLLTEACHPVRLGDLGNLAQVLWQFLSLSLFSLGGGNTLLAEYHHLSVDKFCWLTGSQFADLYALAEAAPGPSSMIVGLLGLGAVLGPAQRLWRRDRDPAALDPGDGDGLPELAPDGTFALAPGL